MPILRRDVTVFCRNSFHPSIPAQHGEHGSGDPRWLRTPCTVRLGEPNWTLRCLTPSVARRCYRESSVLSRSPQASLSCDGDAWLTAAPEPDATLPG
jgi:hypothetical protein